VVVFVVSAGPGSEPMGVMLDLKADRSTEGESPRKAKPRRARAPKSGEYPARWPQPAEGMSP
jgi:hypothetical protein